MAWSESICHGSLTRPFTRETFSPPILQTADAIVSKLEQKVDIMTDTLLRERVISGGEEREGSVS